MILDDNGWKPTPPVLATVETDLLSSTSGIGVSFVGRAATALYLAYQLARRPGDLEPEVILPAMSCTTPANSACLAGFRPRFADVCPETGLADFGSIKERVTAKTRAVVFIHLYGQTTDLSALADFCRKRGILLIEDAAQALGAKFPDGSAVGSAGDLAVFSFNPTKILECGGGALVARSAVLLDQLASLLTQPLPVSVPPEQARQLSLSYRNLHHGLVGLLRQRPDAPVPDFFVHLRPYYDALLIRPMVRPHALGEDWGRLAGELELRVAHAERYARTLERGPWQLLTGWRKSGVCWRLTLLLESPDSLVTFSEATRHEGYHVSNLYWPVDRLFQTQDDCPAALAFARRVVNLWVGSTVTQDIVEGCAASVRRNAELLVL
jgi:dTDP-4-amino-4,6-dideoxygalactose transaminase